MNTLYHRLWSTVLLVYIVGFFLCIFVAPLPQVCFIKNYLLERINNTHFIVGAPRVPASYISRVSQSKKSQPSVDCQQLLCSADGRIAHALFSPDDKVQEVLIDLIDKEQQQIDIAVFSFTNKKIADALIRAQRRGVKICIVIDTANVYDRFAKADQLHKAGIDIFVYNQVHKKSMITDKMHNKFVIFYKNILNKPLIWTGSFNFTRSAAKANQENVVILEEKIIIDRYVQQFANLQKRSTHCDHKKELRVAGG